MIIRPLSAARTAAYAAAALLLVFAGFVASAPGFYGL